MGTPYRGAGGTGGWGVESTWGTAVSRTNWLRARALEVRSGLDLAPRGHLGTYGQDTENIRELVSLTEACTGYFEHDWSYNDSSLLLLGAAMGTSSCSTTGPSGSQHTHTFTLKQALHVGLTHEAILGNTKARVVEGLMISKTTLRGVAGQILTARHDWIAQTAGALASPGSPTYSSGGAPVIYHQSGNLTIGSLNDDILDFTLTIDRGLIPKRRFGSKYTKYPTQDPLRPMVTIDVTRDWDGTTEHADYLAETATNDLAITMTGAGDNVLTITGQNAQLVDDPIQAITQAGDLALTLRYRCLSDGTNQGLSIVAKNSNSAHTAN